MYHLYTHNDLDGVSCGILAKCAFGEKVEIRYNSIGGLNDQVARYLERPKKKSSLIITDLSVNEQNERGLDAYYRAGGKVLLLDHHKTALHLNEYPWGKVQVEYENGKLASATSLLYEHFIQQRLLKPTKALDDYVELVRLYDTWEWEKAGRVEAKRLNDLFFMVSMEEFEETMLERLEDDDQPFAFSDFEDKILNIEEERIERYVRRKKRELVQTYIHDRCVGIVHAESYHSELGHELGRDNPHLDYIAILNVGGKKMSLRTIHDHIDVSEIAARFGGGGHSKASGCSMGEEVYRLYVSETFTMEPVRPDAFKNKYNLKDSPFGTLYENRKEQQIFIFSSDKEWEVDVDDQECSERFSTFAQAERFVKRRFSAWLVRDEAYVHYLMEQRSDKRSRALVLV
ncbi:DHH family phosphoesterase [Paenibacillus sp. YYML68]|uniref:DHH family phosphoesterase n=1 Tax=Paenibacillus sp. YYML68 TaxID=2909250 RepID=UPI0024904A16|nr:oligoribonuclease [Paenibacillus sp. YYML68]